MRVATITATVDDINRGDDILGFNDPAVQPQKQAKAWQITLTSKQDGTASTNYDGAPVPQENGATDLGWVEPNKPAGATWYCGNTQLTGTLPAPAQASGYVWKQEYRGIVRRMINGMWDYKENTNGQWVAENIQGYAYQDTDARHPDGTGADVREIFLMDAPGVIFANPVPPAGWTEYQHNKLWRTWVEFNGGKISNEEAWSVSFRLTVQGNGWVVAAHTP